VNLEYLARGVHEKEGIFYPDTLVGTDSHTTMINGSGVVGWGVGGIEAEAGMLGQPIYFLTPDVVGVHLKGALKEGVTATDLVLTVTEMLRKEKVVGTFVEFYGGALSELSLPDRATIANMAPEYGATMGFFPVDDTTLDYFKATGRTEEEISAFRAYFEVQRMYGVPKHGEIEYSRVIELDISSIRPSVAGPRRPQDRIELKELKRTFAGLFTKPLSEGGFAKQPEELSQRFRAGGSLDVGSGDVIIAAITSCTNTSNPAVLLAAGILAKKAVERGLETKKRVKTSLAPGSRVVTSYLKNAGLLPHLEQLGFYIAAYGCTTCIGNAGPLDEAVEDAIVRNGLVCAAAISGNRNFEARIHPNLRANFLMSPPLVVAFALAGTVLCDLEKEPLGVGKDGEDIFLRDIWPARDEVAAMMKFAADPQIFRELYGDLAGSNELWNAVDAVSGNVYSWPASTYIAEPPFFSAFEMKPKKVGDILGARVLGIFGDSVTTDHISPAGSIKESSPAGRYLIGKGVPRSGFQSYGTRRGNHDVMVRGTFANVRIRNLMLPPREDGSFIEGGYTLFQPSGEQLSIYDAAMKYRELRIPTVIFGGEEYGTGSSRDWAAKGTQLLGVRAVIARSFERIHRSNLVGMGVLPLQFMGSDSVQTLALRGDEEFDVYVPEQMKPRQEIRMIVRRRDGSKADVVLLSRIDTSIEIEYYWHAGILPYVLRSLMGGEDI
ncbi:MAG: aconitate hydratase AcnA, partial [Nitrospirae bacterium]|nr:aconitate hydratase AcnA [Nitrospirota bacterium]